MSKSSLDQQRGAHAWKAVDRLKKKVPEEIDRKKAGGHARKLPVRIMAAGLGHALGFVLAKGEAPIMLEELNDWVLGRFPTRRPARCDKGSALLHAILNGSAEDLRLFTAEALAWLQWFNRFAQAEGLADPTQD